MMIIIHSIIIIKNRFDFETRSQPPTFLLGVEPVPPQKDEVVTVHPVPITIFSLTRFVPRVGLPRSLFLIGSYGGAKTLQGFGPKRPESCDGNWVYSRN